MNILTAVAFTISTLGVLVWGLAGVLHDLLERGPYDAPLIDAPLIEESPRGQDLAGWPADGEPGHSECWR